MHNLDFDAAALQHILDGSKTIDVRLGTPQNIKLRIGDVVTIADTETYATVTQLLYFESLEELFSAVSYTNVMPEAGSAGQVVQYLRKQYSDSDEYEYGVMAIKFALVS